MLLNPPSNGFQRGVMVVEKGAAKRFTSKWVKDGYVAAWRMYFDLTYVKEISRNLFSPPPNVNSAMITINRKATPMVPVKDYLAFRGLADYALKEPRASIDLALKGVFTPPQIRPMLIPMIFLVLLNKDYQPNRIIQRANKWGERIGTMAWRSNADLAISHYVCSPWSWRNHYDRKVDEEAFRGHSWKIAKQNGRQSHEAIFNVDGPICCFGVGYFFVRRQFDVYGKSISSSRPACQHSFLYRMHSGFLSSRLCAYRSVCLFSFDNSRCYNFNRDRFAVLHRIVERIASKSGHYLEYDVVQLAFYPLRVPDFACCALDGEKSRVTFNRLMTPMPRLRDWNEQADMVKYC